MSDNTQPTNAASGSNTTRNRRSNKKAASNTGKIIAAVILILLIAVYGGGVYYYSSHFPHNTVINHVKVGEMDTAAAEKAFTDDLASHKISLKEKERTEVIDANDVGTVINVGSQITDLHDSMNPWLWFTNLFGEKKYTVKLDVTYDEAKLEEVVNNLECFKKENVTAPKSAYIKAGDSQFEIVPEVLGNTVKKKALLQLIGTDLSTGITKIDLEKENLYKHTKYYAKDQVVTDALDKANTYASGTITYDFDYTKETLDYNTSKNWVKISKDFKVTLDESKVGDYVEKLGSKYNTMGSSRPFTTAYGSKINVYGGDYGWKIYFDKEKAQLIKELKSGKDVEREPVYSYKARCRKSAKNDIGNSYVEVSISNQEVWLFVNGECKVNSSVVTGDPTKGHQTYTGVYALTYKQRNATLTGPNAGGGSYSSKVSFWMPFNGGQGLHDATWRPSFGGSIYRGNGSHGCVNCPYSTAAVLYKYVEEGFPVIIY